MVLNRDQIRDFIDGMVESSLRDCGYDLTISEIFGKNAQGLVQESTDDFDLDPQGIALVISKETLKLPQNVCANAIVKTSLCREGILAVNIGVVDPGWEGCRCSKIMSPLNCNETLSPYQDGDNESEGVPAGESD
jgi:deoxycytidine triphosphate deaminase